MILKIAILSLVTLSSISISAAEKLSCPLLVNYLGLGEKKRVETILEYLGYKVTSDLSGLLVDTDVLLKDQGRFMDKVMIAAHIVENGNQKKQLADVKHTGYYFTSDNPETNEKYSKLDKDSAAHSVLIKLPACSTLIAELNKEEDKKDDATTDGKRESKIPSVDSNLKGYQSHESAPK